MLSLVPVRVKNKPFPPPGVLLDEKSAQVSEIVLSGTAETIAAVNNKQHHSG
jgi:hypothetical protein